MAVQSEGSEQDFSEEGTGEYAKEQSQMQTPTSSVGNTSFVSGFAGDRMTPNNARVSGMFGVDGSSRPTLTPVNRDPYSNQFSINLV